MFKRTLPLAVLLAATPAAAEVVNADAHGFEVRQSITLVVPPPRAFAAISQVQNWWSKVHSFSGKSENLSLQMRPGGCFCERLDEGGGVEFMHVVFLQPGERVVLRGTLGPLLFEAGEGVLDLKVDRIAGGSKISLSYKAAGFDKGNGADLAPLVDAVLGVQMKRLRAYAAGAPRR
ncbi:MAG: SRPBCC family protein [Sphingomonas sp.]|uniref:ATPase n=1 Tax=Sphingomonas sp. TaxID=28214 RepID=UPI001829548E|nr:ATPase [Sphingomonas sp.]MBA3666816.1 SRPBCC family protein [Sphingomonas sp.]